MPQVYVAHVVAVILKTNHDNVAFLSLWKNVVDLEDCSIYAPQITMSSNYIIGPSISPIQSQIQGCLKRIYLFRQGVVY